MLPPEPRLPGVRAMIGQRQYFVVHAPRQTGKTTALATLARELTAEGGHAAIRFSCEAAKVAGDGYATAEAQVLGMIRRAARGALPQELHPPEPWPDAAPGLRLGEGLSDHPARHPPTQFSVKL